MSANDNHGNGLTIQHLPMKREKQNTGSRSSHDDQRSSKYCYEIDIDTCEMQTPAFQRNAPVHKDIYLCLSNKY